MENKFVEYLNTLHNYNAQNQNSYGERNIDSSFFKETMVEIELGKYIKNLLEKEDPHIIILTGHAGDGKTSIMYQVLTDLGIEFKVDEKIGEYTSSNGKTCECIKDFSEIADSSKVKVLSEALNRPSRGDYVFMVANTGPLINTFGQLFENKEIAERAKISLIEAMDSNTGTIKEIEGYRICVINVALVDNTYFAEKYLRNIIRPNIWKECEECEKSSFCLIFRNYRLIRDNIDQVVDFINKHYIWVTEYGKRLTIRSMTEQLAYMITGGFNCDKIERVDAYKYLFPNLFFGYIGTRYDNRAMNIIAIKEAFECAYDNRRMRIDEELLINGSYSKLFSKEVADILQEADTDYKGVNGWNEFLRRIYFMLNINTDKNQKMADIEDIFSKQFDRFLELRSGKSNPSKSDTRLICDALSVIYIGTINKSDQLIPVTLNRESGLMQNVQLVIGLLYPTQVNVISKNSVGSSFGENVTKKILKLKIDGQELKTVLTLPLINYFEDIKEGVISTNIDPQLSHGVESIKAEISEIIENQNSEEQRCNNYEDDFSIIILKNSGPEPVDLVITNDKMIKEA